MNTSIISLKNVEQSLEFGEAACLAVIIVELFYTSPKTNNLNRLR